MNIPPFCKFTPDFGAMAGRKLGQDHFVAAVKEAWARVGIGVDVRIDDRGEIRSDLLNGLPPTGGV